MHNLRLRQLKNPCIHRISQIGADCNTEKGEETHINSKRNVFADRTNVEMTMNDNNDLLAIALDQIGRLQTRSQPNNKAHSQKRTKRRGEGGKFEQLKDHDDPI